LTNNVVQLLEQEIVGAQMLKIHEAGYKVAVECYDGIVCVVPEEAAQQCLQFMLATMKTRPAWGQDLPITAEGSIGKTWFEAK
jgi:DNA polymerase I-like protein with 3'-5' exonuclease and polymerase domains